MIEKRVVWLVGALVIGACHAQGGKPSLDAFLGTWKVVRVNNYAAINTGEANIRALLGTTVDISRQRIIEGNEEACTVDPKTDTVAMVDTASDMPPQEGLSPASAGLPSKALKLQTSCMDFYRVGRNLVFADRGAYYTAEPMK